MGIATQLLQGANLVMVGSEITQEATREQAGLAGLVPLKRGPRSGHKLTPEVMAFLATKLNSEPSLKFHQLAALLKEEFDIQIHPRSIERQLLREKKRR